MSSFISFRPDIAVVVLKIRKAKELYVEVCSLQVTKVRREECSSETTAQVSNLDCSLS